MNTGLVGCYNNSPDRGITPTSRFTKSWTAPQQRVKLFTTSTISVIVGITSYLALGEQTPRSMSYALRAKATGARRMSGDQKGG
jgi:hypothetical protein